MTYREWHSCDRKKSHRYKDGALQHRERLLGLPNCIGPTRLEVYCCLYCWNWHVGHQPMSAEELKAHRIRLARQPMTFEQATRFLTSFDWH